MTATAQSTQERDSKLTAILNAILSGKLSGKALAQAEADLQALKALLPCDCCALGLGTATRNICDWCMVA